MKQLNKNQMEKLEGGQIGIDPPGGPGGMICQDCHPLVLMICGVCHTLCFTTFGAVISQCQSPVL